MEDHAVVTAMTVLIKGKAIYDESATTIYIDDEVGGPFLVIKQEPDSGNQEIRISIEEWPTIKAAIEKMFSECDLLGGC